MKAKLEQLDARLAELNSLLVQEEITKNMDQYRKLNREHAEISPVVEQFQLYQQAQADEEAAIAMQSDPDMKEFAEEEIRDARARMENMQSDLQRLLLPKDPNDDKNIFLEIRAGTGGDESALFAADLFRMYTRYAERQRWQIEVVSASESDLGGYKAGFIHQLVQVPLCLKQMPSVILKSTRLTFVSTRLELLVQVDNILIKQILRFALPIYQLAQWLSVKMIEANIVIVSKP